MIRLKVAPELRQHRTELVAIHGEIGSVRSELTVKIEAVRSEPTTRIEAAESRLDGKINVLETKINVVGSKITIREIADLCIRVERLERERGPLPQ